MTKTHDINIFTINLTVCFYCIGSDRSGAGLAGSIVGAGLDPIG
jgi:hypothetical protein